MTTHIENLLQFFIADKKHHAYRQEPVPADFLAREYSKDGIPDFQRAEKRLRWMLENEKPVVFSFDAIALLRTLPAIPEIFTEEEWTEIRKDHAVHEQGKVCNISPDYALLMDVGTRAKRQEILRVLEEAAGESALYLKSLLGTLDALENFAEKYAAEALRVGNQAVADMFKHIPWEAPRSFREALQFLRLIHFALWCAFNYHNTLGRFDQYMLPYYARDIAAGKLNDEEALELIEEFFLSCNKDSDLYTGMQQGDNGQSVMLGGMTPEGEPGFNSLSALCLKASLELRLIDPKMNLRVDKNTPIEIYKTGSELTKQGLGFPQYANDDVVIKALKNWGYADRDANNYTVAACWEFIVPGRGMDIPNIAGLSFPQAVKEAMETEDAWHSFDAMMESVRWAIHRQAESIMENTKNIYMEPTPLMSLLMEGCVEKARDISLGGVYNNYGIHGTGLSTAVDSLAALRKYVFEESRFSREDIARMLMNNFQGEEEALALLRYQSPKMGNDDDAVDALATRLLDDFADALKGHINDRGGIFRPGTGSAMYYIWHAKDAPATPDGRLRGEALACNYSPSLFSRCKGPVSIIKSFTKPHLSKVCNGGPLTIELADSMFRSEDSVRKVALFVKSFIDMGGHQMQLNSVNRDTLMDAKNHPEDHRNLIVRVWGWSGYFVELDEVYQDHIIERMELSLA